MLWYKQLQENHPNLTLLRRIGHTYLLRDDNVSLEVFPQHSNLSIFDKENKENQGFYLLAKVEGFQAENCTKTWVPLLSGYTIYTLHANHFYKFQIQKTEDCKLAFLWVDYGCDSSFIVPKKSKIEDNLFKFRSQIDCSGRFSIPFLLGLNIYENVAYLRGIVNSTFSGLFVKSEPFFMALKNTQQLNKSIKRKSNVIENSFENNSNLKSIVNTGVIVRKGVKLNPLESQAAFVRVQELENQMHNEKRKKKRL
ncbi:764_t:CDS:1 [Entrophospora sp. SA101]|nr:15017_t:CDS:1 [Entrophospora sp. SA101]CAJ0751288.1 764_t:CDS:1 [Entrophospora sp. SA101]